MAVIRTMMKQIRRELEEMSAVPVLTATNILELPEALRHFVAQILLNRAVTCEQAALLLGETQENAQSLLNDLSARGFIERLPICGEPRFRVCLEPRRLRLPTDLMDRLETL